MNNTPRRMALSVQGQYRLTRPKLDDIVAIITERGYEIIDFEPESEALTLLTGELALTPDILSQNAFVYQRGGVRLVFIKISLTSEEKLYVLAHELGHIVLGHTTNGSSSIAEEYEANEFVHYLLNPSLMLQGRVGVRNHTRASIALLIIAVLLVVGVVVANYWIDKTKYAGEYYVTPYGTKYHRRECSVIRDRTNLKKLTVEEFDDYDPCKLCLPELQK